MISVNQVKKWKPLNCKITEQYCLCNKCNNLFYNKDANFGTVVRESKRRRTIAGFCPKCHEVLYLQGIFYTPADVTKAQLKRYNLDSLNLEYLNKLKEKTNGYDYVKSLEDDDFETPKFLYHDLLKRYNKNKEISDRKLKFISRNICNIRKYYKNIARCKFLAFMSDYSDEYADVCYWYQDKYNYYDRLQNQIIRIILENKSLYEIWFTDYSKIVNKLQEMGNEEKSDVMIGLITLKKTIEEFEYANYIPTFNITYEREQELKRKGERVEIIYTVEQMKEWLSKNKERVDKFKLTSCAADRLEDEGKVNDGDESYQLSEEEAKKYDEIIRQAEMTGDYGLESLISV